eukprot:CAMPEP_0168546158 /NCGR_PEP_ID=MMETSP0413-20121227/3350_1 /TAXON_ID=136452 /ORGANISM="Filamoeba nolandi, Strain NC-AS-23-1" /LENGTH=620 /DNA_ID=CAMNT_0008576319 /DNA_START=152 /DNA_END=2011 /DNA_ORIENTATION=+
MSGKPFHKCIHSTLQMPQIGKAALEYDHSRQYKKDSFTNGYNNIRILMDFSHQDRSTTADSAYTCYSTSQTITLMNGTSYDCTSDDVITSEKENILRTILNDAESILETSLGVIPVSGNLYIPGSVQNCFPSSYAQLQPDSSYYQPTGVSNTDMVIFISARPTLQDSTVAFGGYCATDLIDRPTAGFFNFNPKEIQEDEDWYSSMLGVALHEISHALGFSWSGIGNFRHSDGTPMPLSESVIYETIRGVNVTKLATPTVVQKVREHFGCDTLNGAELENVPYSGTQLSHWEKRIFLNEYMIGTVSDYPVFSAITLAYFHDSGWYQANFSMAQTLPWGLNQGCSFAEDKCDNWNKDYFCTKFVTGCTQDRLSKGFCNVVSYENSLPAQYQYFDNSKQGGVDEIADYCPYYSPISEFDSFCIISQNNAENSLSQEESSERFCANCRCFMSSLYKGGSGSSKKPLCYDTHCTGPDTLKIRVNGYWYNCPFGEKLKAEDFGGELECPKSADLCHDAEVDNTWPEFESIEPDSGNPGDVVYINGTNFTPNMTVVIGEPARNCTFISSVQYICKIAPDSEFKNPKNLLSTKYSVMMQDTQGRSCVGYAAYELKLPFSNFLELIFDW